MKMCGNRPPMTVKSKQRLHPISFWLSATSTIYLTFSCIFLVIVSDSCDVSVLPYLAMEISFLKALSPFLCPASFSFPGSS